MGFNYGTVIIFFLVSVFLTCISFLVSDMVYYTSLDENILNEKYSVINETYLISDSSGTIIEGGEINPQGQDQGIYANAPVSGKSLTDSIKIISKIMAEIPEVFGFPTSLFYIIIGLFGFMSSMSFLYLIIGRKP
jgi:hypothetical protein